MRSFTSSIYTLKHNEKSAAEAVAWEGHTAEDRERMARSTGYITLAVSRGGMGYCCTSLSLWERAVVMNPQRPYTKEKCSCLPTHAASVSALGLSVLCSCAWPLPPPGATLIKPLWICSAACLRRLHATTVRVLRICISMTKLRWTWLYPSHSNLLRNSVVRNALPRSQRQCRHQLRHHPRLHSRGEDAKGQLM